MIIDLPDTTTKDVSKALVRMRNDVGAMTLGRVMTLIIVTDEAGAEEALKAATQASRQHPSRIIALVRSNARGATRMDAQVRIGGDAGVAEIVVLRLYGELAAHGASVVTPLLAADSPVVAWWPVHANDVAGSAIGKIATRRITDASLSKDPRKELRKRREEYANGDSDMAWARTTRWRALLATALDQPPYESVTAVTVTGATDSASTDLLAGWLAVRLKCPVRRTKAKPGVGLVSVRMERASGPIDLVRTGGSATLTQPGQPTRRLDLTRPGTAESLSEELRRLDKDEVYREALVRGMPLVINSGKTATEAVANGSAPSPSRAKRAAAKAAQRGVSARTLEKMSPPAGAPGESEADKQAARDAGSGGSSSSAAGKATAKKATAKKATAKKATAKKTTAKKATKKATATRTAATKATPRTATAKRTAAAGGTAS
ncbi:glucose-6-phosphate dehydrogenase assembly protein OpcA [Rudaeicoccus suwonensis]|uniref:Glucose-6-phosphate dehydrogenase assembly protein OpcA n=1 Tax=Rudaeicoccus suwonensis TaxID=657409 RepID=A0A561EAQ1_9MICO|nr:glucose-6-phosphate dehydrogenase assembly protein OpcA [Rudaeicoccus suwonensis]TWE12684.1 glucose-6-phosphate dehydrogenase assembly protein OpcA [Rudaeicoccus suwonensis]